MSQQFETVTSSARVFNDCLDDGQTHAAPAVAAGDALAWSEQGAAWRVPTARWVNQGEFCQKPRWSASLPCSAQFQLKFVAPIREIV